MHAPWRARAAGTSAAQSLVSTTFLFPLSVFFFFFGGFSSAIRLPPRARGIVRLFCWPGKLHTNGGTSRRRKYGHGRECLSRLRWPCVLGGDTRSSLI
jgi:hypothetical protein